MARLIDYIIDDVREHTENEDFSDTEGISDNEFIRFINDAQYRIHNKITQQHPSVFIKEKIYSIVSNQESYTLPHDIYLSNKVTQVDYKPTTSDSGYYPLKHGSLRNRLSGVRGDPERYIRKSGTVLVAPTPQSSSGKLRLSYVSKVPELAKRSASVSAITLNSSDNSITSLTLDIATDSIDSVTLNKRNYFTVVDRNGNIQMSRIEFDSIDTSTGVVTITSGFSYDSGESIAAGDYLVTGKYATTHSELNEMVERYLIAYASWKILKRDSSIDSQEAMGELAQMESDIIEAYADVEDDITEIPVIDEDFDWGY